MMIVGDIGSLIDFFSFTEEVYQNTYITRNYHGNPVKQKNFIRLPISHYHGNAVKLKKSIRLPISPEITMAML
jgi:hypothetical protein